VLNRTVSAPDAGLGNCISGGGDALAAGAVGESTAYVHTRDANDLWTRLKRIESIFIDCTNRFGDNARVEHSAMIVSTGEE
jgi:hypothetical protein